MEKNILIKRVSELLTTDYEKTSDVIYNLFQKISDLILSDKYFYIDNIGTLHIEKNDDKYSLSIDKEKKRDSINIKDIEDLENDLDIKKYYKTIISTLKYILIEGNDIDIKDFGIFSTDEDKLFVASKNLQDKINEKYIISKNEEDNEIIEDINDDEIDIEYDNNLLKKDDDNSITEEIVENNKKLDIDDLIKEMLTTDSENDETKSNTKTNKRKKIDNAVLENRDSSVELVEDIIEDYEEYIVESNYEETLENKMNEIDDIVDNLNKNTIRNFLDSIEQKSNNIDNKAINKKRDDDEATEAKLKEIEIRKIEEDRLLKEEELKEMKLQDREDFKRQNKYKKIENKKRDDLKKQKEKEALEAQKLKKTETRELKKAEKRNFRKEREMELKEKESQLSEEQKTKDLLHEKEDKLRQSNMSKFRKLKKNKNYQNILKEEVIGMLKKQEKEKKSKVLPIIIGLFVVIVIVYMTSITLKRFKAPSMAQIPTVELNQTLSDIVDNYFTSTGQSPQLKYTTDKDMYFWEISKDIYGESLYWPLIFALNTDVLKSTGIVKKGTRVTYKNIPQGKKKFLKYDSLGVTLSKSYLYLYEILINERRPKHAIWVARLSAYFDKNTFKKWKRRIPSSLYDDITKNANIVEN